MSCLSGNAARSFGITRSIGTLSGTAMIIRHTDEAALSTHTATPFWSSSLSGISFSRMAMRGLRRSGYSSASEVPNCLQQIPRAYDALRCSLKESSANALRIAGDKTPFQHPKPRPSSSSNRPAMVAIVSTRSSVGLCGLLSSPRTPIACSKWADGNVGPSTFPTHTMKSMAPRKYSSTDSSPSWNEQGASFLRSSTISSKQAENVPFVDCGPTAVSTRLAVSQTVLTTSLSS
mmetsp:Transcript_15469/g.26200  ORF Transcript_15469/g.26200 Transcript_15469/m.26200 type:complete len:233 (+) Transcript_15469:287-985(+)